MLKSEVRLEELCLRSVLCNAPGNLYWKNMQGIYLGANKNFIDIVGEVTGKTAFEVYEPNEAKVIDETDRRVMLSGKEQVLHEITYYKGFKQTYLTHKKPMYDYNGHIIGMMGISFEVTQEERIQNLEYEQAICRQQMSAMKTIASSMSHDLRNILAGINLGLGRLNGFFNQWLKRNLPKDDVQDLKEQKGLIAKLIQRIKEAVTFLEIQLKNITTERIDTSKFTILRISECIKKALDDFAWENNDMRQRVKVSINEDWIFQGDLTLTKHLLFNLLSNSTHYIKEEGKGNINIVVAIEEEQPILYFRDTAKGIAESEAPNIFDRFFSNRTNGTGLGLAFCKSVVLAYSGDITCTGKENEFIEFKIKLPRLIDGHRRKSLVCEINKCEE